MVQEEAVVLLVIEIVSFLGIIDNETNSIPFSIASAAITQHLRKNQTPAGTAKVSASHDLVLLIPVPALLFAASDAVGLVCSALVSLFLVCIDIIRLITHCLSSEIPRPPLSKLRVFIFV